jgi:DNA adenine methylase
VKTLTQPLKWHGGKYYLRNWIISLMPPHLHYVEPFFGGGGILLARDPARDWMDTGKEKLPAALKGSSEVANDLHGELTNFWKVLQKADDFEAFRKKVALTPFSEVEFAEALDATQNAAPEDTAENRVERAHRFFVLARQSRQGLMKDFATLSRNRTRGRINEQVNAWLSVVEGLPEVHERLKNVLILTRRTFMKHARQPANIIMRWMKLSTISCWGFSPGSKANSCSVVTQVSSMRTTSIATAGNAMII